ncbi:MAG: 1-deoxy-D-xylulose-5-phosphate reductoisomerase [Pelagibacteraceae bacterium]|mgnify:CR=1 FL=1|nr:1-deoxy-D-xylulose-5-phosphate reductoisomerase [Pelagibacteraceae bacterium]|tara:strand:+ start:27559 stop:28746 length:1188 start_codon:yes stop_codon:yes gene_type:complete
MKKNISILGSTGSIGLSTLKIISKKKKLFNINVLAANKNYKLIYHQLKKYRPKVFLITDLKVFQKINKIHKNKKTKLINNIDSNKRFIQNSDITISAIPGIAGLKPTIELIKKSKKVLIANKESIICGWSLIKKTAFKHKSKIIPVDSEHFSIMKLLEKQNIKDVKKIYITASGGPFLNHKISKLKKVKPQDAIKHPKWKMGKKISIDSASLMNKLLEVIEANKLFNLDIKKFDIVIHPQSLVHAIVEFKNGLYKFIYHETSMLVPLANAIFDSSVTIEDFIKPKSHSKKSIFFQKLDFLKVDKKRFPIVNLKPRLAELKSTPIIINAVNEILVDQFIQKKIPFTSFYKYILMVLNDRNYNKYAIKEPKNISQILQVDQWSRETISRKILTNKNV